MISNRTNARFSVATLVCCLIIACAIAPVASWAQQVTASITGQITDPSGAPVSGAKVTATDTDRGTEYTTQTNAGGNYHIQQMAVGSYTITVEYSGFQTTKQSGIILQ